MALDLDVTELDGACHCGTVTFKVTLADGLRTARRCNCSYCRMRGAVAVSAAVDGVTILTGAETLSVYSYNTKVAQHYFCSKCGIYTHHRRRSDASGFGVNAATLAGVSPFDFLELNVNDGIAHPSDGNPPRVAGVLRYTPND